MDNKNGKAETTHRIGLLTKRMDIAGVWTSTLCAIHCALMPFLVNLLPLIGLGFFASEPAEWSLVLLAGILGLTSLCMGYRIHKRRLAIAALGAGLFLLAVGRVAERQEQDSLGITLVVLGGLTIAGAHLINRWLCKTCPVCKDHSHKH